MNKTTKPQDKERPQQESIQEESTDYATRLDAVQRDLDRERAERRHLETVLLESEAYVRELQRLLTHAYEEERGRIAKDLHDQIGQRLTALKLAFSVWERDSYNPLVAQYRLEQVRELTTRLMDEMHDLTRSLRPVALDENLDDALRRYVGVWSKSSNIPVSYQSAGFDVHPCPSHIMMTVYRIIQEALTNILKHAGARHVNVVMRRDPDLIMATVEDDGRGFDIEEVMNAPDPYVRLGMVGMRERAELAGGGLTIDSAPGDGTTVQIRVPVYEL